MLRSMLRFVGVGILASFILSPGAKAKGTGDVGSVGAKPAGARINFLDCLKAINEKSVAYKNKIVPLGDDGWSYVIRKDDGTLLVKTEDHVVYELAPKSRSKWSGKAQCKEVTEGEQSFGAGDLNKIFNDAMTKDKTSNSIANRKEIVDRCKAVGIPMAVGTGMMMGGPGMMMGAPVK